MGEAALIESAVRYGIFAVLFVTLFIYTIREHKVREQALMEEIRECRAERTVWLGELAKITASQEATANTQRETAATLQRIEVRLQGVK